MRKTSIRIKTLEFRLRDFGSFREEVGNILSVAVPKCQKSLTSRLILKDSHFKAWNPSQYAGSQAKTAEGQLGLSVNSWPSSNTKVDWRSRAGTGTQHECSDIASACRNGVKAKAQLELKITREVKGSKKDFDSYDINKRKTKEKFGHCWMG